MHQIFVTDVISIVSTTVDEILYIVDICLLHNAGSYLFMRSKNCVRSKMIYFER